MTRRIRTHTLFGAVLLAVAVVFGICSTGSSRLRADNAFLRGDINTDGRISLSDALGLRRYLFTGELEPTCLDAADANDDGNVNIADVLWVTNFAFRNGPPPTAPYPKPGTDPTEDRDQLGCQSYEAVEPEATNDLIRLGDVSGSPGEEVEIPVFVRSSAGVEAYQLVVRYDPEVFTPLEDSGPGSATPALTFEGTFYEDRLFDGVSFSVLVVDASEGIFILVFSPNFGAPEVWEDREERTVLPASTEETLVFKIVGTVSENAEPGTTVPVGPTNGPDDQGSGPLRMRNELTSRGEVRFISAVPRVEGMVLKIVEDLSFFRGDSNGDQAVDMSDSLYTLNFLFADSETPSCMDAADANDDGAVNVADPIATLMTLFGGAGELPPPYSSAGHDPTEDGIVCLPTGA